MLQEGHLEIVCMKALARSYLWWLGLDSELEQVTKSEHSVSEGAKRTCSCTVTPLAVACQTMGTLSLQFRSKDECSS